MSDFDKLDLEVEDMLVDQDPNVADFVEDSITFTKALWDLLKKNGLNHPSDVPDIQVMEHVIDSIYGELAAACMMFTDAAYAKLPLVFVNAAKTLESKDHPDVPKQLIKGFRDFGIRLENTQKHKESIMNLNKE